MSAIDLTALIVAIVFTVAFIGCCWLVAGEKPKWFVCPDCEIFHKPNGARSISPPDDWDGVANYDYQCHECAAARLTRRAR